MSDSTQQPQQPQQWQQQPMQPQQPPQPKKKPFYKKVWFWIVVIVVVIVIGASVGGGNNGSSTASNTKGSTDSSQAATDDTKTKNESDATVEMQATATGNGTATWGEAGSTSQESFTQNWSKTITGDDAKKGYTLSVMGDLTGGDDQQVTCTVLVNGEQKSHKEATGAAGNVLCDTTGIFN